MTKGMMRRPPRALKPPVMRKDRLRPGTGPTRGKHPAFGRAIIRPLPASTTKRNRKMKIRNDLESANITPAQPGFVLLTLIWDVGGDDVLPYFIVENPIIAWHVQGQWDPRVRKYKYHADPVTPDPWLMDDPTSEVIQYPSGRVVDQNDGGNDYDNREKWIESVCKQQRKARAAKASPPIAVNSN